MNKVHRFVIKKPWIWCGFLLAFIFLLSLSSRYHAPGHFPISGQEVPFEGILLVVALLYEVFRKRAFSDTLTLLHFYLTAIGIFILGGNLLFDITGNFDLYGSEPIEITGHRSWIPQSGFILFFVGQIVFLFNFFRALILGPSELVSE